jgi:hypothetical protein
MRRIVCTLAFLMAIYLFPQVLGQQESQSEKDKLNKDLRIIPGKLLAEGSNNTPLGPHQLLTYRLEEIPLSERLELQSRATKQTSVFRLTITGGESLASANMIWVDDRALIGVWSGLREIGVLINDRSILKDGAIISVGRGEEIYDLPERLKLPDSFRVKPEEVQEGNRIVQISAVSRIVDSEQQRFVVIQMQTAAALPIMDSSYYVQIGRKFFSRVGGYGFNWTAELTERQFAELKNGDRVAIGIGVLNIAYLGRLDKSLVNK